MKESENALDVKESQKKRNIARDLKYLKGLIRGIKLEDVSFSEIKSKVESHSFKGTVLISSKETIYRHVSILALSKWFNRNTSYTIVPLDTLVDRWFSNMSSGINYKEELWNTDVLILQGKNTLDRTAGPLRRVLVEVIETRKSFDKNTWLFIESTSDSVVYNNSLLALSDYADKVYNY